MCITLLADLIFGRAVGERGGMRVCQPGGGGRGRGRGTEVVDDSKYSTCVIHADAQYFKDTI